MFIANESEGTVYVTEADDTAVVHLGQGAQQFNTAAEVKSAFPGMLIESDSDAFAPTIPPPNQEYMQAIAESVVMQHIVKEKVAELTWKSTVQYHTGDVVYHDGRMWKATSNNTNNEPDDVIGDWEKVA